MKNCLLILSFLLLSGTLFSQEPLKTDSNHQHIHCGHDILLERLLKNPEKKKLYDAMNDRLRTKKSVNSQAKSGGISEYVIPVVVHVIHQGETVGSGSNISNNQIMSQIEALNVAFNGDYTSYSSGPNGINTDIRFCLASEIWDANSNSSTGTFSGILRYNNSTVSNHVMNTAGQQDLMTLANDYPLGPGSGVRLFPYDKYLNIYVVNSITNPGNSGIVMGYSPTPLAQNYGGNPFMELDGVVIRAAAFGDVTNSTYGAGLSLAVKPFFPGNYDEGKVLAHEVGHYLSVLHTFHGGCTGTDEVADTDPCAIPAPYNYSCSSSVSDGCTPTGINTQTNNFMYYIEDECVNTFTAGQITRMQNFINSTRSTLVSTTNHVDVGLISTGCAPSVLTADFQASPNFICENDAVSFTTFSGTGFTAVQWTWDFMDSSPAVTINAPSNPNISHVFTTAGTYSVELTAEDAGGTTEVCTFDITVSACPPINNPQKDHWYFGDRVTIEFGSGVATATNTATINNTMVDQTECSVCFSDATGDLKFYTNGSTIWDATHTVIGSTGLPHPGGGYASIGQMVAVPDPGNSDQAYLFIPPINGGSSTFNYYLINYVTGTITANSLSVTSGNNIGEGVSANPHANGEDYWIIFKENNPNNNYVVYRLTAAGLFDRDLCNANTPNYYSTSRQGSFYIKCSPDGNHIGTIGGIHDFDRATGIISNETLLSPATSAGLWYTKCSFSPNSNAFFVAHGNIVRQYNMAGGLQSNTSVVATPTSNFQMQMGPDDRLYLSPTNGNTRLAAFTTPDVLGAPSYFFSAVNYLFVNLTLPPSQDISNNIGLPNFMDAEEVPLHNHVLDITNISCNAINVSVNALHGNFSYEWNWGDSSPNTITSVPTANHAYTSGTAPYTVTCTMTNGCETIVVTGTANPTSSSLIPAISGPAAPCPGGVIPDYYLNNVPPGYNTHNWMVSANGSFATGGATGAGTWNQIVWTGSGTITVVSSNGVPSCDITTTYTVNPVAAAEVDLSLTHDCSNNGSGSASWTPAATGPNQPYTYSTDGGVSFGTVTSMGSLGVGSHGFIIQDATGCWTNITFNIFDDNGLSASVNSVSNYGGYEVSCFGFADGNIDIDVTGGTAPYLYDWDNDGTGDNDDPEDLSAIGVGTYVLVVTDDNGCQAWLSQTMTQPAPNPASIDIFSNDPLVCASGPALLEITQTLINATYQWQIQSLPGGGPIWANLITGTNPTHLATSDGVYRVIVTLCDGTVLTSTNTLIYSLGVSGTVNTVQPTTCECDGEIHIVPQPNVTAVISDVNGVPVSSNTGLCSGEYNVVFTSTVSGCTFTQNVILSALSGTHFTNVFWNTVLPPSSNVNPIIVTGTFHVTATNTMGISNASIVIDHAATMIVDGTLNIEGTRITFRDENHICQINSGGQMNVLSNAGVPSILTSGRCGRTWGGVRNQGGFHMESSIIEHAQIAVASDGTGPIIMARASRFKNNYIGIQVTNNGSTNLNLIDNDFELTLPQLNPFPYTPLPTTQGFYADKHVYISSSTYNPLVSSIDKNRFFRAVRGVDINLSAGVLATNNSFTENTVGVLVDNQSNKVGLSLNEFFTDMVDNQTGIIVRNQSHASITNGTFSVINNTAPQNYTGILVQTNSNATITDNRMVSVQGFGDLAIKITSDSYGNCNKNVIKEFDEGIVANNGAELYATLNTISNPITGIRARDVSQLLLDRNNVATSGAITPVVGTIGILVRGDVTGGFGQLKSNVIRNFEHGIRIRNGADALIERNIVDVAKIGINLLDAGKSDVNFNEINNTVRFGVNMRDIAMLNAGNVHRNTISESATGINARNSHFIAVGSNKITNFSQSNGTGIFMRDCQSVVGLSANNYPIEANYISNFRKGMYFRESNFQRADRNTVELCETGIHLRQRDWVIPAELHENHMLQNELGLRCQRTNSPNPEIKLRLQCNTIEESSDRAILFQGGTWDVRDLQDVPVVFTRFIQGTAGTTFNEIRVAGGASVHYNWPAPLVPFPSPFTIYQPSLNISGPGSNVLFPIASAKVDICNSAGKSIEADNAKDQDSDFVLYPNPSNGRFTIGGPDISMVERLTITNNIGQLVFQVSNPGEANVDLSGMPPGIYLVQVISVNGQTQVERLVIQD